MTVVGGLVFNSKYMSFVTNMRYEGNVVENIHIRDVNVSFSLFSTIHFLGTNIKSDLSQSISTLQTLDCLNNSLTNVTLNTLYDDHDYSIFNFKFADELDYVSTFKPEAVLKTHPYNYIVTLTFANNRVQNSSFNAKSLLTFAFLSHAGNLSITNNSISQSQLGNATFFNLMYHTNTLIHNNSFSLNLGSSSSKAYFLNFNHFGGMYDMSQGRVLNISNNLFESGQPGEFLIQGPVFKYSSEQKDRFSQSIITNNTFKRMGK